MVVCRTYILSVSPHKFSILPFTANINVLRSAYSLSDSSDPIPQPHLIPYPPPIFVQLQQNVQSARVQHVKFYEDDIYVTVAKSFVHIDQWIHGISNMLLLARSALVGLDIEWLPNLNPGEDHPTATMQLCVGHCCLIVQLLHLDKIPYSLHKFLNDSRFRFCGVGVGDDVKKLYLHHGLIVGRYEDINDLVKNKRCIRIKRMAKEVLGKEMAKPLKVTLSKWDAENLDEDQIEYGAIDAFVSLRIVTCQHRAQKIN